MLKNLVEQSVPTLGISFKGISTLWYNSQIKTELVYKHIKQL